MFEHWTFRLMEIQGGSVFDALKSRSVGSRVGIADRFIVVLRDDAVSIQTNADAEMFARSVQGLSDILVLSPGVNGSTARMSLETARGLARDDRVPYVEQEQLYTVPRPGDATLDRAATA